MSPKIIPINQDPWVRQLIYADPGAGKTTYAASGGPGTLLIRSPMDQIPATALSSGASQVIVKNWGDMYEHLEWSRQEGDKYEWQWLDSATLFQDVGMDDIWETVTTEKPARLKAWYDRGEYRMNMGKLSEWIRYMIGCEMFNFGITAHAIWHEMESSEADEAGEMYSKLMPLIQGWNMPQKVSGYMTMVGYMEKRKLKEGGYVRRINFNGDNRFYAKDQYDAFGAKGILVDPTVPKMMQAVNAARGAKAALRSTTAPVRRRTRRSA